MIQWQSTPDTATSSILDCAPKLIGIDGIGFIRSMIHEYRFVFVRLTNNSHKILAEDRGKIHKETGTLFAIEARSNHFHNLHSSTRSKNHIDETCSVGA